MAIFGQCSRQLRRALGSNGFLRNTSRFVFSEMPKPSRSSSFSSNAFKDSPRFGRFYKGFIPGAAASISAIGVGAVIMYVSSANEAIASADAEGATKVLVDPSSMGSPVTTKSGRVLPKLRVYIGYDPREHDAYEVCRHSILKHATIPVEITPIKQSDLRKAGLYTRSRDPTESTEFSFSRFLTPFLAGYDGWAMFVDCDFLYTSDIRELAELIDDKYAIMCVQHDYQPKTATKMDGVVQTTYPRKNWSSMVLYNCSHPKNRVLTPMVVNSQSGAFLHRFLWLDEADIGSIPFTWNYLVGHNKMPPGEVSPPKAIHYTTGGPWFEAWKDCEYGDLWIKEMDEYRRTSMIQKVIQDDFKKLLDAKMNERSSEFDSKLCELESRLAEVNALQRLLLFYLQEKMSSSAGSNGKEKPLSATANNNGKEYSKEYSFD